MVVAKKKKKKGSKAQRKCSICSKPDHNARTCPEAEANAEPEAEVEEDLEPEVEEELAPAAPVVTTKQKASIKKHNSAFDAFVTRVSEKWEGTIAVADELTKDIPRISSGNLGIDIATYGGWPRGRIIRVYGREKSAKSGSCWNTVVCWQHQHCGICYERDPCDHGSVSGVDRPKAKALWIDAENRVKDMWYWPEGHGVDLECLLVQAPPSGQHIVDFVDSAIRAEGAGIGLIIVDSVAHMTSQEEIKKETMKGRNMAVNAALLNRGLRKWIAAQCELGVKASRVPTIILINQLRKTLDQYNPEVMPGGEAQKYATSIDVRFSRRKEHYLVEDENGNIEDKIKAFGSRWTPDQDASPYYVEIDYRVTASGICPNARYGQFNYWTQEGHGRRLGDPDNVDRMWEYVRRLNLMEKQTKGYKLFSLEARTQALMKNAFYADAAAQSEVWKVIVERLIQA